MNARDAFARLRRLGVPVVETADAAAALNQSVYAASKTLSRLAESELVTQVRHGLWWIDTRVNAFRLSEYLTAPFPSYLSLQTGLHLHGMIEQIPETIYVVSLARTQTVATKVGTYSIHHVAPELFGGFERTPEDIPLATPEKTLFELAYLSAGRSRLFARLPELTLPKGFRRRELQRWVQRIPNAKRRVVVMRRLAGFLASAEVA